MAWSPLVITFIALVYFYYFTSCFPPNKSFHTHSLFTKKLPKVISKFPTIYPFTTTSLQLPISQSHPLSTFDVVIIKNIAFFTLVPSLLEISFSICHHSRWDSTGEIIFLFIQRMTCNSILPHPRWSKIHLSKAVQMLVSGNYMNFSLQIIFQYSMCHVASGKSRKI